MTVLVRRLLTAVGTGVALMGAAVAALSAPGAPQQPQHTNSLHQAVHKEEAATKALQQALRRMQTSDIAARASVATLSLVLAGDRTRQASSQVQAPAQAAAQPAVHSSTGASGGGDDSSGGGDD